MLNMGLEFLPRMIAASFSIFMSGPIATKETSAFSTKSFQHGCEPIVASYPDLFSALAK